MKARLEVENQNKALTDGHSHPSELRVTLDRSLYIAILISIGLFFLSTPVFAQILTNKPPISSPPKWERKWPTTSPSPRFTVMTYDFHVRRQMLSGGKAKPVGSYFADWTNDMWEYDSINNKWTPGYDSPPAKPPKVFSTFTFMLSQHGSIEYGGVNCWPCGGESTREAWGYNTSGQGRVWDLTRRPKHYQSAAERHGHGAAWDIKRDVLVAHGGMRKNEYLNDTWEMEWQQGAATEVWTQIPGPGPSARKLFTMAYDSARERVVMFGGRRGIPYGDTWTYDGQWTQQQIAGPTPRSGHGMAYDPKRRKMIVFGGNASPAGPANLDDTWEYNGKAWRKIDLEFHPVARNLPAMASDHNGIILFGGFIPLREIYFNDTWRFGN